MDTKTGWAPQIREKLAEYGLEENLDIIKSKTRLQWKKEVETAVNVVNRKALRKECFETKLGVSKAKSKTAFLIDEIDSDQYERKLMEPIQKLNRHQTKGLFLSFRMLECGRNFKSTLPEVCPTCDVTDNEHHRLNICTRFRQTNLCDTVNKVNFEDVFSSDIAVITNALSHIENVWNLKLGHGSMVQTN